MKKMLLLIISVLAISALPLLMGSYASELYRLNVHVDTASCSITRNESGRVFVSNKTGILTWTLPDAEAGLIYTFVDNSATAGDDVVIDCASGDNINGDTNGDGITCATDAAGQQITLLAIDSTRWVTFAEDGTWAQQ